MKVVVLDHVWIRFGHRRHQPPDQVRLGRVIPARGLEHLFGPGRMPHCDHEDPAPLGAQARRLEVELHPLELIEGKLAEVGPAGDDQVLLLGRQRQHCRLVEVAQVVERAPQASRRAAQDRPRQGSSIRGAHHESELAGPVELAVGHCRVRVAVGC